MEVTKERSFRDFFTILSGKLIALEVYLALGE